MEAVEFPKSEVFHKFLCLPQWLLFRTFHFTSKLQKTWHLGSIALGHCTAHITIPLHQMLMLKHTYKRLCSYPECSPLAPHSPSLALLLILDFAVLLTGTFFVLPTVTVPHAWGAFPPLTFTVGPWTSLPARPTPSWQDMVVRWRRCLTQSSNLISVF